MLKFIKEMLSDVKTNYPSTKRTAYMLIMLVVALSLFGLAGTIVGLSISNGMAAMPHLISAFEFLTALALTAVTTGYIGGKRMERQGDKESATTKSDS